MKKNYLIDIIITAYNVNAYIERCIDSVIEVADVNVIVVDDGSTENTDYLVEKYGHCDNFKFYRKANGGLSSARNYGMAKSSAEYIMNLDGDDFIETEQLEKAIKKIKKTRKNAYYFSFKEYFEDTQRYAEHSALEVYYSKEDFVSVQDKGFIESPFIMVAWRYIIKRLLITKHNLYFVDGIVHEDEEWTPRLLCEVDKVYGLKAFLYCYRQRRAGSIMSKITNKHLMDSVKVIQLLFDYKKNLVDDNKIRFIENCMLFRYEELAKRYSRALIEDRALFRKELKKAKKMLVIDKAVKRAIYKHLPLTAASYYIKFREAWKSM